MPQAVDNLSPVVEQLSARLRDLESRLTALESNCTMQSGPVTLSGDAASTEAARESRAPCLRHKPSVDSALTPDLKASRPSVAWRGFSGNESSAGIFPTLGKAVLGFAGAFLLRALAESGSLPRLPIILLAILYACVWMIWSARTANRFASVTYGITSTLILSPMLWEATVRFHALSPSVSATVLIGFIMLTLLLAARNDLQLVPWIATVATVTTAIALIIGTHALVPLAAALLVIAAATEFNVCLGHELTFRAIPATAADFSIWLSIYILGSGTVPEAYDPVDPAILIALCALLPALYAAGIGFRTFIQLRRITFFDIGQAAVSFALAAFGIITVSHSAAAPALGLIFFVLAASCYWGTLSRFAADPHTRNRRVCASWAAALLLAGTFLLLPPNSQATFLCIAALLAAIVYTRTARLSLGLHASFYLASAAAVSPLVVYVWRALAGTVPASPHWSAWGVAFAAALCYAVESRHSVDEGSRRLLWIVPAGIVAFTIAAWAVSAVVRLSAGHIAVAASHLSMIRTIVICVLALALGLASRRRHIELRWIAYAAVALGTLKLLLEDLRFGNPASLVVSFLFYGLILILLPRLTKSPQVTLDSRS